MGNYILSRDNSHFLLANGAHKISSSSIDGLISALSQPEIFGRVYGAIHVPESFDDGRTPLTKDEREKFLGNYRVS
jgi:hypothetical protein